MEEELYYRCSENKGADQLRGYHREADLRLCFRKCKKNRFSHAAAHFRGYRGNCSFQLNFSMKFM